MYAWLWPAWDALARPEARRRHRAFPRHGPRGQSGQGRGRGRAGRWTWPRRARFLPAGRDLRRPGPVLARGRPASGAPLQPRCHLLLLGFPSSSSFSASSVSRGKAAACCSAPHPRLACPRVGATSKLQKMSGILRELLRVSEKAANIARACRQQEALFQLLIEEKKGGEKNKKFAVDFKTLADVLVQEVIKQNMDSKFPGLGKKILGEESNEFTNDLGEKITMELCSTEEATAELLSRVLNGNKSASEALARVVHEDVAFSDPTLEALDVSIPQDILGIWVDPIDSTYQYIKGSADVTPNQGVFPNGLQCVTILIGVYDIETGMPLMGVINQPFVTQDLNTLRWKGRCYWGLSYMGTNIHSLQLDIAGRISTETQTEKASYDAELSPPFSAVISTSEKESVKAALSRVCGGSIFRAAGAGYKSLCVVQGLVDIYIFSEDTTYKWDVCAAHAILRAMGGGVVDMKECLQRSPDAGLALPQLLYHAENQGASGVDRWANQGGLIAYRSARRLEAFLSHLTQNLSSLETQT